MPAKSNEASVFFYSSGSTLATTSGDTTVKIWNFSQPGCTHTFTDHTLAGLGLVGVHHCGYACSKNSKLSVTVRDWTVDATLRTFMATSDSLV